MHDFFIAIGVPHGEVEGRLVDDFGFHAPALVRVSEGLLQIYELGEIVVVKRVGLAEFASGVELVVPHLAGGGALLEEQHHGLDARALESAARTVEYGV